MSTLMLAGGTSTYGIGMDFAVLVLAAAVMIYVASRAYPHVVM